MSDPIYVTVSESLECDGGSIDATDADGNRLPVRRVRSRRQFRTEHVTYQIGDDTPGTDGELIAAHPDPTGQCTHTFPQPTWMSSGPCRCDLPAGHDGGHSCRHLRDAAPNADTAPVCATCNGSRRVFRWKTDTPPDSDNDLDVTVPCPEDTNHPDTQETPDA